MQCNIDARGRQVRLIGGLLSLVAAVLLGALAVVLGGWWLWTLSGVVFILGVFQIFEAKHGWCALRAMGFRTPV